MRTRAFERVALLLGRLPEGSIQIVDPVQEGGLRLLLTDLSVMGRFFEIEFSEDGTLWLFRLWGHDGSGNTFD